MGRKKTYDYEELLTCVTRLFWQKGFKATTVSDLEAATGLNRKSLFHEFQSKEELFQRALSHYLKIKAAPDGAPLMRQPLGARNIRRFFQHIRYNEDEWGCLLALTIVEKDSVPRGAFELARDTYQQIEQAFLANLLPEVERGALKNRREAQALATFLKNSLLGIIVNGRAGASNAALKHVVRHTLSLLP